MKRAEIYTLVGIGIALFGAFGGITYWQQPRLSATGEVGSWFIPEAFSGTALNTYYIGSPNPDITPDYLKNVRSLVTILLRNVGGSTAEDVHINLPYRGVYSFDLGETLQPYTDEITIGKLLPRTSKKQSPSGQMPFKLGSLTEIF